MLFYTLTDAYITRALIIIKNFNDNKLIIKLLSKIFELFVSWKHAFNIKSKKNLILWKKFITIFSTLILTHFRTLIQTVISL